VNSSGSFSLATTSDGSFSLYESKLDELYHNRAGAYTEAMVTYVKPALQFLQGAKPGAEIKVLDSCFGLGYNSLALANASINNNINKSNSNFNSNFNFDIDAIEIDHSVLELVPKVIEQACLSDLHQALTAKQIDLKLFVGGKIALTGVKFQVLICDLRHFLKEQTATEPLYDLIFHDPFSPKKVPELWSIDLLQHYYRLMGDESSLLTYSSAPAVRGALLDLGFKVFRTTALGGKSGGTMAVKSKLPDFVMPAGEFVMALSAEEQKRLATSSRVPYRDEELCQQKDNILRRREAEQKDFLNLF